MKLLRYRTVSGQVKLGALTQSGDIADLVGLAETLGEPIHFFEDMNTLIEGGADALLSAQKCLDEASQSEGSQYVISYSPAMLACPLPDPPALRLCTVYPGHFVQARQAAALLAERELGVKAPSDFPDTPPPLFFEHPYFCRGNHKSLGGPGDDIIWPNYAQYLDFECEIAAVLGSGGANLGQESAKAAIFGFTILNDVSARLPQLQEMPFGIGPCKGKGFDGGMKIGPVIVTADEFFPSTQRAEIRVNGEVWSKTTIAGAAFDWPSIISFASAGETLVPGEVISSGCIENGSGIELNRWLSPGVLLEFDVEGIGVLANPVAT
ncbi:fumarylacetoacetate hydrolase family protein [Hyphococcus flavus]|uniref:Fumarylacetoacetate hydrolase family protein n=1 Tax=Hyphococcus flavus TaxID=1866326 RepID=A0AAE9ZBV3_9PROT|nr:fumarylacetoacetate hydrolase family protein [Hyphococcus flavus]WDI31839.1 fumarylacetoacetate hydrolase family protein [Hyphococcus flavus]